jgi:hypothetical protein
MVDGLHILIQNRTVKPLAIALSGVGRTRGTWWGQANQCTYVRLLRIDTKNPPSSMNIA